MGKSVNLVLISIIIPVYNRDKKLKKTLKSIADQAYRPIELILVDNGSKDNSLEICENFKNNFENSTFSIKVFQEFKKGANAARNTGLAKATGEYVMFFDSDDKMYSDCLSSIVNELEQEDFPSAITFPFLIHFPDGKMSLRPHFFSNDPADQLFDAIMPTHGVCISRKMMKKIGPWDEQLKRWQDLEFGFRVLQTIDDLIWFAEKPLYEVLAHKNSISGKSYISDHEILYASLMKINDTIDNQPNSDEKDRLTRALCYKIGNLAAQIFKEGNFNLGNYYLQRAIARLPKAKRKRAILLLRFQFIYEGNGGRGLWRIARKLL